MIIYRDIIVNPRLTKTPLCYNAMHGNVLFRKEWFHDEDASRQSLNLKTGTLETFDPYYFHPDFLNFVEWLCEAAGLKSYQVVEMQILDPKGYRNWLNRYWMWVYSLLNVSILGSYAVHHLLAALAGHQVEGDEVIKGLRADGYKTDNVKFIRNYLGGYNIIPNIHIETFCRYLSQQDE